MNLLPDYYTAVGTIEERVPGVQMKIINNSGHLWHSNGEYFERPFTQTIIATSLEEAEQKLVNHYKNKEGYVLLDYEIFETIE